MGRKQPGSLTAKQRSFFEHYKLSRNGTKAAINAGYPKPSARQVASELLAKPEIAKLVLEHEEELRKKYEATEAKIIDTLTAIAFTDLDDILSWKKGILTVADSTKLSKEQIAAIESVEQRVTEKGRKYLVVKRADRKWAIERLERHLGIGKDKDGAPGSGGESADRGNREALLKRVSDALRKRNGEGNPPGAAGS